MVDRPACSRRVNGRGRLHLGQRLTPHLHPLGQRPARYGLEASPHVSGAVLTQCLPNTPPPPPLDNGDGTCVAMTTGQIGGFWDDKQCAERHAFVCEKPRPDITPPPKPPTPPPSQGCADGWTALPHFRNCYRVHGGSRRDKLKARYGTAGRFF